MSLVLVEADEGSLRGSYPTGKRRYCMLRGRKLKQEDKNRKVTFMLKNVRVYGKVVEVYDEPSVILNEMRRRNSEAIKKDQEDKFFVLQFFKNKVPVREEVMQVKTAKAILKKLRISLNAIQNDLRQMIAEDKAAPAVSNE